MNYKSAGHLKLLDCIGADARTALELIYADQLYHGLKYLDYSTLEKFLQSVVPTPTLDDVQQYFDVKICMPFVSTNTFNAHRITAYNL